MRYLRALLDPVERTPDAPFLIEASSGRELTFAAAQERIGAVGADLRRRGLQPGDRLAVSLPNGAPLALLYLASLQAGVVVVPLGSGFSRRELRMILAAAEPRLAIASDPPDPRLADVAEELGISVATDLGPFAVPADGFEPFAGRSSDDLAAIHFTSGTTGTPRGVAHRVRDFVGNAQRFAAATGLDASHRLHATLPMTYMAGYYNLLLLPWTIGASVVVDRAFDAASLLRFWDAPREHGVDTLWLVPTIMAMLLETDRGDEGAAWCAEHIRFAACGTAPLPTDVRARFEQRYGVTVHDSYGLSETLLATASTPARPAPPGCVGVPLDGVDVAVRDGEILLRTPDMFGGYLDHDRLASPLVDGGFMPTGDTGRIDDEGRLWITGRSKEIIIRGGVNVSAVEVEQALRGHPAVERVAVVGIPHRLLGEEIAAVVTLRSAELDAIEPELKARAREVLQPEQQPGVYVEIDELPATPTGKIRKGLLRDLVIDRLGLPAAAKGFAVEHDEPSENGAGAAGPVDLTHRIREGMTTFPGLNHPRVEVTQLARHGVEGRATHRIVLGSHTGTHVDAPLHFIPDGDGVDALDLDVLIGPAHFVDLTPAEPLQEITAARLQTALGGAPRHPRLLLRFDWSERYDSLAFYSESPYLSEDTCRWLIEQGVRLIGMDSPSPDDPRRGFGSAKDSPNHHLLLGAGIVIVEYLANLAKIRGSEVTLVVAPLPIAGADGAPARVLALPW